MTPEEIINKIDEGFYKENFYYLSITEPEEFAKRVAEEFGQQCFEAGRKIIPFPNPNIDYAIDDPADWEECKFKTFEEYLKELYEK